MSSEYVYLDNDEDGKEEEYIKEIVFIGSELAFVSERDGHEIVNITDIYVSRLYDPDDPDRIQELDRMKQLIGITRGVPEGVLKHFIPLQAQRSRRQHLLKTGYYR